MLVALIIVAVFGSTVFLMSCGCAMARADRVMREMFTAQNDFDATGHGHNWQPQQQARATELALLNTVNPGVYEKDRETNCTS